MSRIRGVIRGQESGPGASGGTGRPVSASGLVMLAEGASYDHTGDLFLDFIAFARSRSSATPGGGQRGPPPPPRSANWRGNAWVLAGFQMPDPDSRASSALTSRLTESRSRH